MSKFPNGLQKAGLSLVAGLGALVLTIGLFGLLPALLQAVPDQEPAHAALASVVIRQVDSRKAPQPSAQPQEEQRQSAARPAPAPEPMHHDPAPPLLSALSLDIAPDMPSIPVGMASATLQAVSISAPQALSAPSAGAVSLYQTGDIDGPLTPMGNMQPMYPLKAKRGRIQGKVMVEFVVGINGGVEDLKIVDYTPPGIAGIFDQSVMQAVSTWRFAPGTVEGRPVRTLARAPIEFVLE